MAINALSYLGVNSDNLPDWLDYATKRATMLSALRKAFQMSSDSAQALVSIKAKCAEFLRLGYPPGIIKYMCLRLSKEMPDSAWHYVRMTI